MQTANWGEKFRAVFQRAQKTYRGGGKSPATMVTGADLEFLKGIGCSAQELFDFVDDLERYGEPDYETVLLVTAVRRDFFLYEQNGKLSQKQVTMESLPPKKEAVDGIEWLPRLIVKARAKLRGEMPPDLMYLCGGDRPFLRDMNVDPADFLRFVWQAKDDDRCVIDYVKSCRDSKHPAAGR